MVDVVIIMDFNLFTGAVGANCQLWGILEGFRIGWECE